jgi:hypothetical protein
MKTRYFIGAASIVLALIVALSSFSLGYAQPVSELEAKLTASRANLLNMRETLYESFLDLQAFQIPSLLESRVEAADQLLTQYVNESNGNWSMTYTKLTVTGLTIAGSIGALPSYDTTTAEGQQEEMFNVGYQMEPEHYTIPPYDTVPPIIVETMGGLPTRSYLGERYTAADAPSFITPFIDSSFPVQSIASAAIQSGTVFTYVLQMYKPTANGFEALLYIWYPSAAPAQYCHDHAKHYAIEFRNAILVGAGLYGKPLPDDVTITVQTPDTNGVQPSTLIDQYELQGAQRSYCLMQTVLMEQLLNKQFAIKPMELGAPCKVSEMYGLPMPGWAQ